LASIKDVAKEAGVSVATVSHVINKTKYVSSELTARVEEAVSKLGYKANMFAKGLKTKKSNIIGLIVHDMNNPLDFELVNGALEAAGKHSYGLLIFNSEGRLEKEKEAIKSLVLQYVDGIILDPIGGKNPEVNRLKCQGIPIIFAERYIKGVKTQSILADMKDGTYQAIKHLIDNGHEHIGFVANSVNINISKDIFDGYLKALTEAGIRFRPDLVKTESPNINGGYKSVVNLMLLDPKPTAIFVSDSLMTLGAVDAFNQLGLKYPDDVAFVGVADLQWPTVVKPSLTVISPPAKQIGINSVETLINIINGVDTYRNAKVYIPVKFVIGESSMGKRERSPQQSSV
jgi:LacI family transcriptional regulator